MCVSLAVSHGSSELILNSPRLLKSYQRQKRCVPPMSPALNQCLHREENRFQNSELGSQGWRCLLQPCWDPAGSSHLPPEAAGASNILLQFHKQSDGGRALAWLKAERISRSDDATWRACSGTTPGRGERETAFAWSPHATITPSQFIINSSLTCPGSLLPNLMVFTEHFTNQSTQLSRPHHSQMQNWNNTQFQLYFIQGHLQ